MSILITGVEGFLGRHLAALLHAGGARVVGLDVVAGTPRPGPVLTGDVTNRALLERLFAEHDVTHIVHAGGVSGPHVCNPCPARVFEVNVLGTLNLLEVARLRKLPGRMVLLSSSSVYGQAAEKASCQTPVVESLPLLASEPYGCSKVSSEALAVALRISIVYGAGRTAYCGITQMIQSALRKEPILLDRGCDLPLPWVYVDDVSSALRIALEVPKDRIRQKDTLAYNVSGPGYPTFRQIARLVQELVPGAVVQESGAPDLYAMNARKMSLTAIQRDLEWEPRVRIADGVRLLYRALTGSPE